MKDFASLLQRIENAPTSEEKVFVLLKYFESSNSRDKLWAIALLTNRRPKKSIPASNLKDWSCEVADVPAWLFEQSYRMVGDLIETVTLLVPEPEKITERTLSYWLDLIDELKEKHASDQQNLIIQAWTELGRDERLIFNKLLTGGFRQSLRKKLIVSALAKQLKKEESEVAHCLKKTWSPQLKTFEDIFLQADFDPSISKPYPFFLGNEFDDEFSYPTDMEEWSAEWKWLGIRIQLIKRKSEIFLWSRDEDLITRSFPELKLVAAGLQDGTAIDGMLIPHHDGKPLNYTHIERRMGRQNVTKKLMLESPVVLMAFDILEYNSEDVRSLALDRRRELLEMVVANVDSSILLTSEPLRLSTWEQLSVERNNARIIGADGIVLKKKSSPYLMSRHRSWLKWKADPLTIDAILLYAKRGQGRQTGQYVEYTFAVWDEDRLVTFAKTTADLPEEESLLIASFIKKNTKEKFGPVRSLNPELVFELAFEGIEASKRHKSGITLRLPRIISWRKNMSINEANTLGDLKRLLNGNNE